MPHYLVLLNLLSVVLLHAFCDTVCICESCWNSLGKEECSRLQLCSSPPGLRKTTWHVDATTSSAAAAAVGGELDEVAATQQQQPLIDNSDAQRLLAIAANRVWEELYVCKKPVLLFCVLSCLLT